MRTVRPSPDWHRIKALPTRDASALDFGSAMVEPMTRKYSINPANPDPEMGWLKPLQAQALYELEQLGGCFCGMRIGDGKTLTSLLAGEALRAVRPLLVLPANLIDKTRHEIETVYRRHWRLPPNLRILSYEAIGAPGKGERLLENFDPDLFVFDEAHFVKNPKSARVRRIMRFIDARRPWVMALSGTFARIGIEDYAHILAWTHGNGSPAPLNRETVIAWDEAIGDKAADYARRDPGVICELAPVYASDIAERDEQADDDRTRFARVAYQKRMRDTPGIIMSKGKGIPVNLTISFLRYELPQRTRDMIDKVIDDFETPDGWLIDSAAQARACARELALGYHSIWDPRPPEPWRQARAEWFKFVRQVVQYSKELDSEKPVKDAVLDGRIARREIQVTRVQRTPKGETREIQQWATGGELLATWQAIEPTFAPNPVDIWHDGVALSVCQEWGKKAPGIVWTENVFFALQLARMTGWDYYGEGGLNARGGAIEQEDGSRVIIASRPANGQGRNLQTAYGRNLITQLLPKSGVNDQLLGRTHRSGQLRDEVTADILCGTEYVEDAWDRAIRNAKALRDMSGEDPKILSAEVVNG